MSIEIVKAALERIAGYAAIDNGVRLNTHCLYPNNGFVRVVVYGAGNEFFVTDEGGAFREASKAGADVHYKDRKFTIALSRQGLQIKDGAISTPIVSMDALPAAITLVANASKETAEWIFEHWKLERTRKFKDLLKTLLKIEFIDVKEQDITGVSNKPHSFDSVVQFLNGSRLLVDAVIKDSNSVNARVVANLDVKNAEHLGLVQSIVYDDEDEWGAADLNLLKVSGVSVVPFSKAGMVLKRIAQQDVQRDLIH